MDVRAAMVAVTALVGCVDVPAQLVVVVDSDYPPGEIHHFLQTRLR